MTDLATTYLSSVEGSFLHGFTREHRRTEGLVYTPEPLVDLVLDQLLGEGEPPREPTLDPSCGTGVFVRAMIRRIAAHLRSPHQWDGTIDHAEFLRQVATLIWAVDVDGAALSTARGATLALLRELSPGPIPTDFMATNFIQTDFLGADIAQVGLPTIRHIVGNPPYVAVDRIDDVAQARYRRDFATAFGRIDLYTLFMEQATRLLHGGGSWCLITPDKFLSSHSAAPIRRLLISEGHVASLLRFSSHRVFVDAATVPCITVWQRGDHGVRGALTAMGRAQLSPAGRTVRITGYSDLSSVGDAGWSVRRDASARSLAEQIARGHPRLDQMTSRISAGPATGYNPAWILSLKDAAEIEPELIHPTVRGRDIGAFTITRSHQRFLLPYTWSASGASQLIELDSFPRAASWLMKHRSALESRHCVRRWGKAWWDLHDPVGPRLDLMPKVVVPDLARGNRFAVDVESVPQHSAYYLRPRSMSVEVLAAILNSPAIEFLMRTSAPIAKDGFLRYRRQFLRELPIPHVDVTMAEAIRARVQEGDTLTATTLAQSLFEVDAQAVDDALAALVVAPTRSG